MPVLNHQGIFHPFFAIFAAPGLAPTVSVLVAYGHLLIGLSLLAGLMVRVSASFAIALLILYWLAGIDPPNIPAVNSGIVASVAYAYRIVRYFGGLLGDNHTLYCVVLVYLIAARAGHIWGLDGWVMKLPFLARQRGLRALVA
jgi:thiosulfate dehydrogenase [quinone] large subunit